MKILSFKGRNILTWMLCLSLFPLMSFDSMEEDPLQGANNADRIVMQSAEFRQIKSLYATLPDFDFDAECRITGFQVTRITKRQDPHRTSVKGARITGTASNLMASAKPGDIYFFGDIYSYCPGDERARKLNMLIVHIR